MYKWIYNNGYLLNAIFTNKMQFSLVLFKYKLLAFWTFCFQLIVQLIHLSLVRFLTNNSFHTFEASTRYVGLKFSGWWAFRYLVDSKNMPSFIGYKYLPSIWLAIFSSYCCQNQFISKIRKDRQHLCLLLCVRWASFPGLL